MDIAIKQDEFYKNMFKNDFITNTPINTNGNTNSFPSKYIENILMPYTPTKINKLNETIVDEKSLSSAYNVPADVNLADEDAAKKIYNYNKIISNISCGVDIVNISKEAKDAVKAEYFNYVDISMNFGSLEPIYKRARFSQISKDIKLDVSGNSISKVGINTDVGYNLTDASYIPINITRTFTNGLGSTGGGVGGVFDFLSLLVTEQTNQSIDISNNILTGDKIEWIKDADIFTNVLQLLKIIRCGVIYDNAKYTLHPHYVFKTPFPTHIYSSVQYYLPVIYPPTAEIMYGFTKFLDKKGYKYIWLNNEMDPDKLKQQMYYGSNFTFPIQNYDVSNNNPICIVISPNHKEGFSFIYNPVIISLALCDTPGDQEQVYGRILRKYNIGGLKGKYDKKIYQYFGGSSTDTQYLQTLPAMYGDTDTVVFRGAYDVFGYDRTTLAFIPDTLRSINAASSIAGNIAFGAINGVSKAYQSFSVNKKLFSSETLKRAFKIKMSNQGINTAESAHKDYKFDETKVRKVEELYTKYYSPASFFEESQLKILCAGKKITLDFFNKIVKDDVPIVKDDNTVEFIPLDLKSIIANSQIANLQITTTQNGKKFCFDNLTANRTIDIDGKLKLKNSIICKKPYDPPESQFLSQKTYTGDWDNLEGIRGRFGVIPGVGVFERGSRGGGLNRRKYTIKKNKRKINKKTIKHIK